MEGFKQVPRPKNMSQLDYLWLYFGGYKVQNEQSETPQDDVILTEKVIHELIGNVSDGYISKLQYREHPSDQTKVQLVGIAPDGREVSSVDMPLEVHVQDFLLTEVTQEDIDSGITSLPIKSRVLKLILTNGTQFLINLEDIISQGSVSDTIVTNVLGNVISAHLKIDKGNNTISPVKLKVTSEGVYGDLIISPTSQGVEIVKDQDGIAGRIPLQNTTNYVRFSRLSLDQYQALDIKDPGTIYFITDRPYIFLGSYRYGADINPGESSIISLDYNEEATALTYRTIDGTGEQQIPIGPASESFSGVLTKEDFKNFKESSDTLQWKLIEE